jgi:hypothetical protein
MNQPKTSAKTSKTPKAKAKILKVKTNVKAGRSSNGFNRCETLRRKV